tara:strand:- start:927 stop:1319 length:393 start_codon:yes stop_codon:yes gene_type:complete
MDLPFDIKERIASELPRSTLATMASVDPDFRPLFMKAVGPVFISEFKNAARIYSYLHRIKIMNACLHDIVSDNGDHHLMSFVLGREVEEGELFMDDVEWLIQGTFTAMLDQEPSMGELISEYGRQLKFEN